MSACAPPDAVVDFLVAAEFPKDLSGVAAAPIGPRETSRSGARGKDDVIPRDYESLYLATDEELDALQDENVRRAWLSGTRMNYAAGGPPSVNRIRRIVAALTRAPSRTDRRRRRSSTGRAPPPRTRGR